MWWLMGLSSRTDSSWMYGISVKDAEERDAKTEYLGEINNGASKEYPDAIHDEKNQYGCWEGRLFQ